MEESIKNTITERLHQKGLKRTKLRLWLLNHFTQFGYAQSYSDLKNNLPEMIDKSTLYRNLAVFEKVGLIHKIMDDNGVSKYALGSIATYENHPHFVCERCEGIFCIEGVIHDFSKLPKGYVPKTVQTVIKGVCSNC